MASLNRAIVALLSELRRRKVAQVIIAYGAFAWLLLQISAIVFATFESPAWSMRVLFAVLLLGFPTTVVLAWIFELGPSGIDRTEPLGSYITRKTRLSVVLCAQISQASEVDAVSPSQANLLLREYALEAAEFYSGDTEVIDSELHVTFAEAVDALWFSVRAQGHAQQLHIPLHIGIAGQPDTPDPAAASESGRDSAIQLAQHAETGAILVSGTVREALESAGSWILTDTINEAPMNIVQVVGPAFVIDHNQIDQLADEFKEQLLSTGASEPSTLLKALSLIFLTSVVGLLWAWLPSLQRVEDAPPPTLAVLPFTDPTADTNFAVLVGGLSDDLFNAVARIDQVRIAARRSSRTLRDSNKSVQEIGTLLNAMLLLEGEIRPIAGRLKVTAWLTDTGTGLERWSRSFEQPQERLDLIREELTVGLAEELGLSVAPEVFEIQKAVSRQHPDAYPMYLEALGYLKLSSKTEETLRSAQDRFTQLIELAPEYRAAEAGLCRTYLAWYLTFKDAQQFETAQAYCLETLDSQEENVDLLLALGDLYRLQGSNARAQEFYQRGLALSAGNVEIQRQLAQVYMAESDKDAAERTLLQALAIEPAFQRLYTDLGAFYLRAGRWDDAINIFGKFTELAPDDFGAHANLGSAYFYAGRFPEAATAYERSFTLEPNRTALSNTATMYFYSGEFERAAEFYLQATKLAPKDHRVWINLADAEAQITGAESAAISHYEQACDLMAEHLQVNEKKTETLALVAWCSVNIGDLATAELRITEAVTLAGNDPVILYYAAQVNGRLGKREISASFVRQALENGFPSNVMAATPGLSELIPEE